MTLVVPPELRVQLLDAKRTHSDDLHALVHAMAFRIVRFYLGEIGADANIRLQAEPNAFMLNEFDEQSDNRFVHMSRVMQLADALFRLSGCRGFDTLVARFRERDAKPCFYEANIANDFINGEFDIEIRKETGQRGSDFDFAARKARQTINVEVTAKDAEVPSEGTFYNTLQYKRTQVPADAPAILYVFLPQTWSSNESAMKQATVAGTERFFRGSQRFNAVVIIWEIMQPLAEGMVVREVGHTFMHPNPRHKIDDASFLTGVRDETSLQHFRSRLAAWPESVRLALDANPFNPPPSFLVWALNQRHL